MKKFLGIVLLVATFVAQLVVHLLESLEKLEEAPTGSYG